MIKVFIVDDHEIIREALKKIVNEELDIVVVGEASNGNEVLNGVLKSKCDILLLDLNIPGLSGSNLIKKVRRKTPKVKILILSIKPEDRFILPLLRVGASGYICKDSNLNELISAIRRVYTKGRYLSVGIAEELAFNVLTESNL